jgi:hypothetical protein
MISTPIVPPSLSLTHLSSQQLNQVMPAASDFGDGATVVEAATAGTSHAFVHAARGSTRGKGVEFSPSVKTHTTFAKTPDYFAEERPYVVHIGKKGVLDALHELNEHLLQVRATTRMESCLTFACVKISVSDECFSFSFIADGT